MLADFNTKSRGGKNLLYLVHHLVGHNSTLLLALNTMIDWIWINMSMDLESDWLLVAMRMLEHLGLSFL